MIDILYNLFPFPLITRALENSEVFSLFIASHSIPDIIKLSFSYGLMPGYYIFLHFLTQVFNSSEILLRFFSLFLYAAFSFLFFELLYLKTKRMNLIFYFIWLLMIFNPYLFKSALSINSSVFLLFFISVYIFFLKKNHTIYANIVLLIGLCMHIGFLLLIIYNLLNLFYTSGSNKNKILLSSGIYFIVLLLYMLFFQNALSLFNIVSGLLKNSSFIVTLFLSIFPRNIWLLFICFVLLVLFMYYILDRKDKVNYVNKYLLLLFAITILTQISKPLLYEYLINDIYIYGCFAMLYFLGKLIIKLKYKYLTICSIVLLLFSYISYQTTLKNIKNDNTIKQSLYEINAIKNKNDLIQTLSLSIYLKAKYYAPHNTITYINEEKNIENYEIIDYPKQIRILPVYPQKAFVITNRGDYDVISFY